MPRTDAKARRQVSGSPGLVRNHQPIVLFSYRHIVSPHSYSQSISSPLLNRDWYAARRCGDSGESGRGCDVPERGGPFLHVLTSSLPATYQCWLRSGISFGELWRPDGITRFGAVVIGAGGLDTPSSKAWHKSPDIQNRPLSQVFPAATIG